MRALWSEKSIENNKKPACCAAALHRSDSGRTRFTCAPAFPEQICFTTGPRFGQLRVVRKLLLPCARAQDQESKLVDRLLRPDMTMQNSAQNKKLSADRTSINKQATVRSFYVQTKSNSKTFYGTRDFS